MRIWMRFLVLMACVVAANPGRADEPPVVATSAIGRSITDFTLRDIYGQPRRLTDHPEATATVVAFLGVDCPLAKLYGPRLEALHRRFAEQGVVFYGINSNTQDSLTECGAYGQRHGIQFTLLKDTDQKVADQFGAQRTPEVFLLDARHVVRYHGRIDDQYGIGYVREKPQREELAQAIETLLAGKPIATPATDAVGCIIERPRKTAPTGEITYAGQVAEILNRRCVECHREGQIAPFPLANYDDLIGWGETIEEVVRENRMPPWTANPEYGHFRNDMRLAPEEKRTLLAWIENGMPSGDLTQTPPAPSFAEGWRIEEPDQIVFMRDEPFDVPAEGVVDYQYFEVDPGFEEDKFVCAAQARPDNRAVVHHIIVYIKPPGKDDFRGSGSIDGYAPGNGPNVLREGLAIHVPAHSKLVFEMHYTPNGSPQQDRSCVGIKFLPKDQVKSIMRGGLAINQKFRIPPGDANYEVTAEREIPRDVLLLSLTPHMHLRGKAFRYELINPDGTREILLDVPRYDFNWQFKYELAEPRRLTKGSRIFCTARFDNSADNPFNPDPTSEVRWGDQSWEEMMIGFFDVIPAN